MTLSSGHDAPPKLDRAQFGREWEEWHRGRERSLVSPAGFLAITGLYWLGDEPITLDGAPGAWTSRDDVVRVDLADGERLELHGEAITGHREFEPVPERGGFVVTFPGGRIEIAKRGGRDIARPRRDDAAFLRDYSGTPTYLPNPRWRADATYLPFDEPRPTEVGAAIDGITHVYDAPGELEFTLRGETFRLTAFPGFADGQLLVLFTDATSGLTTYPAVRSLVVPAPDADGRTVLDFNRASNLPCAYTDFATCPLPPAGNRLPVGIEAGEKTPLERVRGIAVDTGLVLERATHREGGAPGGGAHAA
ncbi:hypothetical protein GCM10011490_27330 [Pseudoclavibacter endophyticus]|uniref:DUF1684 domain-containing protein n=1 Tax=Pseudoclavibacter endophyticus TaxID=1778590 RepID=A0A6H9WFD6_9MICO|nr:DUF1684 domain-containing protein [Pseudoclavibacter endophyticus]KAB1646838.1 DUF1684 domain-containing protein [Pseudoclavibacter endophyticus]GGA75119.1 hypothetical protein GCM10011490_27330 [Pseudoclavibacter endophyticus]